jgi:hypothetical protein
MLTTDSIVRLSWVSRSGNQVREILEVARLDLVGGAVTKADEVSGMGARIYADGTADIYTDADTDTPVLLTQGAHWTIV